MKKENYDFNNAKIGTKITFNDGDVVVKIGETYENACRVIHVINESYIRNIVKIEEPQYKTVFIDSAYILKDEEREYLVSIIKPFKDRIIFISKESRTSGQELIHIKLKDDFIKLPYFNKDSMYKNMEVNKAYTLADLGLDRRNKIC